MEGALLVVAGVLLVIPGLISDALALLLLVPPIRRALARLFIRRAVSGGSLRVGTYEARSGPSQHRDRDAPIIEGEFERLGETSKEPRRDK
jgi:UPF0716 protein FxsA